MSILDKKKKLSKENLNELKERLKLINQTVLIAQALELQKGVWLRGKMAELELKNDGDYNVDLNSGVVSEVKKEEEKPKENPNG